MKKVDWRDKEKIGERNKPTENKWG